MLELAFLDSTRFICICKKIPDFWFEQFKKNNKMAKIEMIIKKKIGKSSYTFVLSAPSFHEVVIESSKLSFGDVDTWGICGNDDLFLHGHVTKEDNFEYAYVRCKKCKSTLNFGKQKKDTDVVYLTIKADKSLDWVKFEPKKINE